MGNEVQLAAERLRTNNYKRGTSQKCNDENTLAHAYLNEYLADDDEPITLSWWKGFTGRPRKPYMRFDEKTKIVFTEEFGVSIEIDDGFSIDFHTIKTRGQMRQLVQLLKA